MNTDGNGEWGISGYAGHDTVMVYGRFSLVGLKQIWHCRQVFNFRWWITYFYRRFVLNIKIK